MKIYFDILCSKYQISEIDIEHDFSKSAFEYPYNISVTVSQTLYRHGFNDYVESGDSYRFAIKARELNLTKIYGSIVSETAKLAGITSYVKMPNTDIEIIEIN